MGVHAREDVGEVRDRIHTVFLARYDEGVENGEVVARLLVANEEKILPAECDASKTGFSDVVVGRDGCVTEESSEVAEVAEQVADRAAPMDSSQTSLTSLQLRCALMTSSGASGSTSMICAKSVMPDSELWPHGDRTSTKQPITFGGGRARNFSPSAISFMETTRANGLIMRAIMSANGRSSTTTKIGTPVSCFFENPTMGLGGGKSRACRWAPQSL